MRLGGNEVVSDPPRTVSRSSIKRVRRQRTWCVGFLTGGTTEEDYC